MDPGVALQGWWQLVRPMGYLYCIVPDKDLYKQCVFPSQFNPDHKRRFTISKTKSCSNQSVNVLDLASGLSHGKVLKIAVNEIEYDRSIQKHGLNNRRRPLTLLMRRCYSRWLRSGWPRIRMIDRMCKMRLTIDQTLEPNILAQIECIVQKI